MNYGTSTAAVENPRPHGRTLLHFEGAAQDSEAWIGMESVTGHMGGCDEFTVDITGAVARQGGKANIAVLCENTRHSETIPSDLSCFMRYGSLHRHIDLVYPTVVRTIVS